MPVGIGSLGVVQAEQPHECAMRGFDAVDPSRLLDGAALLSRTLARAAPRAITMLLISGLRDFADLVIAQPALVRRKVCAVAIQGGLILDAAAPYGYAPDTSQNNAFDPAAADVVYNFSFAHGIRMSVVSRDAVPVRARARARPGRVLPRASLRLHAVARAQLLPMQLARSFAVRTKSEVLRYLANAQFLGLAGLWKKLCAGQLPARCDKAWYFATFAASMAPTLSARRSLGSARAQTSSPISTVSSSRTTVRLAAPRAFARRSPRTAHRALVSALQ